MDELKPCKCGNKVFLSGTSIYSEIYHDLIPAFNIKCDNCGLRVGPLPITEKERLIREWNRRAGDGN